MADSAKSARLLTLGRLTMVDREGAEESSLATRRRKLVLLAVLALARRPHSRDTLVEMFWGDQEEARARHSLSDALSHLRRVLGPESITLRRADVELGDDAPLSVDADELLAAAKEQRWADVVSLYTGPFLDAVHVGGSARLESWVDAERDRIERAFVKACGFECERLARAGDWPGCGEVAGRWLERDALSPHAALLRLAALSSTNTDEGDRHAMEEYQRLDRRLQDAYGRAPDERVVRAAAEISGRIAGRVSTPSVAKPVEPQPRTRMPTQADRAPVVEHPAQLPVVEHSAPPMRRIRSRRVIAAALLAAAAVIVLAVRIVSLGQRVETRTGAAPATSIASAADGARNLVLVADFMESGLTPALAELVGATIRIDLSRSPMLRVLRPDAMRAALERMRRAPSSPIDSATAHELAIREALPLLVTGRIATTSDGILITADLIVPATGQRLLTVREVAVDSTSMLDAIERVSRMLRLRAGEPTGSVRTSAPLSAVTTGSLAALQLYTRGVRAYERDGEREEAVRLLDSAIKVDSGFAMAYRRLGLIYNNDVEARDRTAALLTLAVRHGARLPERERHLTNGTYHTLVTNDFGSAAQAYRSLLAIDPTDAAAWNSLGTVYQYLGDYRRAADAYASSTQHDRTSFSAWVNLSDARYSIGDVPGAWAALDSLALVSPAHPSVFMRTASLAQAEGDVARAEASLRRLIATSPESPRVQSIGQMLLARLYWGAGRYSAGDSARERGIAIDSARGAPAAALEGRLELAAASVWLHGDSASARRRIATALQRTSITSLPVLDRPYLDLATAHALAGNTRGARETFAEYERLMPAFAQRADAQRRASVRGTIALVERRYDEAAREYAAVAGPLCPICGMPELAFTLDRAGQGDSALRVYRRYVGTKSLRRADATEGFHGVRVAARVRGSRP